MRRKVTYYELCTLRSIKSELNFCDKILLELFKNYSFKIYKAGFRDKYFKR
jgi:hypothetical protein|nr:MAG TPA: hypothetical protein [Caudoviricetes sp.]